MCYCIDPPVGGACGDVSIHSSSEPAESLLWVAGVSPVYCWVKASNTLVQVVSLLHSCTSRANLESPFHSWSMFLDCDRKLEKSHSCRGENIQTSCRKIPAGIQTSTFSLRRERKTYLKIICLCFWHKNMDVWINFSSGVLGEISISMSVVMPTKRKLPSINASNGL